MSYKKNTLLMLQVAVGRVAQLIVVVLKERIDAGACLHEDIIFNLVPSHESVPMSTALKTRSGWKVSLGNKIGSWYH